MGKLFILFVVVAISAQISETSFWNTYRGAVVEYNPVLGENDEVTMTENVKNYIKFIQTASSRGAQIIVFPEQGLLANIRSRIPHPFDKIAPCDSKFETTKAIKELSCASKNSKIYSVVNVPEERQCEVDDKNCPTVGYYKLNTNVVFDKNGVVIARYSKFNVYAPDEERLKDPEFSFFDTDFGVRFGTFICFDIHFLSPAQRLVQQYGITDFVFTSRWYSELPYLTALQIQRGWAETHNVNLLASGFNNPFYGSSGSGIYNGKFGHIIQVMPEKSGSKLLIADVPKIKTDSCTNACQENTPSVSPGFNYNSTDFSPTPEDRAQVGLALMRENIENYTTVVITPGKAFEETICSKDILCCDFNVNVESLSNESSIYTLRAIVFNGIRKFGSSHFLTVQSCGVVVCNGPMLGNCTNRVEKIPGMFRFRQIDIKGNFKLKNSFQIPTTLTDGKVLEPLPAYKYDFLRSEEEKNAKVSLVLLLPVTDLYSFGIWGRDFTGDGFPDTSVAPTTVSVPVLLMTLIGFLLFAR